MYYASLVCVSLNARGSSEINVHNLVSRNTTILIYIFRDGEEPALWSAQVG